MVDVPVPVVEIGNKQWFLLRNISNKWTFRAFNIKEPRGVREPSDHKAMESKAEGSVKCRPDKEWDLTKYSQEVEERKKTEVSKKKKK
jgi:hypothetical protein